MKFRATCHAKINLFLSVGAPEPSGYHPIRTVFQSIALGDEMTVEAADSESVTFLGAAVPSENTVTKTLRLLREIHNIPPLKMQIEKLVPPESGLGGGSANAGKLMLIVSRIIGRPVDDFFKDVASVVGADVPFFLTGGTALGEGYGDRLTAKDDIPARAVVIVRPNEGISTGAAYAALDRTPRPFLDFPTELPPRSPYNDFERVAPCVCGEIAERLQALGSEFAMLSGSGSAVFGLFSDNELAQKAASNLQEFGKVIVTRTATRAESLQVEQIS